MLSFEDKGFEIRCESHAAAILDRLSCSVAKNERALGTMEIPITEIIGSGGGRPRALSECAAHLMIAAKDLYSKLRKLSTASNGNQFRMRLIVPDFRWEQGNRA